MSTDSNEPSTPAASTEEPESTDAQDPRQPRWAWWVIGIAVPLIAALITVWATLAGDDSSSHQAATAAPPASKPSSSPPTPSPTESPDPSATYGQQLVRQRGVNLPVDKGLDFDEKPIRPIGDAGDLSSPSFPSGNLDPSSFWDTAMLSPNQDQSYESCRDETRYLSGTQFHLDGISPEELPAGSAFCMTHHENGRIALVQVMHRSTSSEASSYVTLDITVWQGPIRE